MTMLLLLLLLTLSTSQNVENHSVEPLFGRSNFPFASFLTTCIALSHMTLYLLDKRANERSFFLFFLSLHSFSLLSLACSITAQAVYDTHCVCICACDTIHDSSFASSPFLWWFVFIKTFSTVINYTHSCCLFARHVYVSLCFSACGFVVAMCCCFLIFACAMMNSIPIVTFRSSVFHFAHPPNHFRQTNRETFTCFDGFLDLFFLQLCLCVCVCQLCSLQYIQCKPFISFWNG